MRKLGMTTAMALLVSVSAASAAAGQEQRAGGPAGSEARALAVWWVGWVCTAITALGRLHELCREGLRG